MTRNDTTASRQWASRPDDQRFTTIPELKTAVASRTDRSRSFITETKHLKVMPTQDNDLYIETAEGPMGLTNWSFGQMCRKAKAPANYLESLPAELAAPDLQWGLDQSESQDGMVLVDDGLTIHEEMMEPPMMRAFTGAKYGRIWDLDVINAVENFNQDDRWRVPGHVHSEPTKRSTTLYASDRDLFMFLVDERNPIQVNGDTLFRGFYTWNSEVGSATFGLAMFLYRRVCANRIIWGQQEYRELRIVHRSSGPDQFRREAAPILTEYANSSARQVEDTLRRAKELEVGRTEDDVTEWLQKRGYKAREAAGIIKSAVAEEGQARSLMDVVNGASALARQISHTDQRVKAERLAGKLLDEVAA